MKKKLFVILLVAALAAGICALGLTACDDVMGLNYTRLDDGTYAVTGRGGVTGSKIVIPSQYNGAAVTRIAPGAFSGDDGITEVEIPESVTDIGYGAFSRCGGLTAINISAAVENIGQLAFTGCTGLTAITVAEGNTAYNSIGNCLIERESGVLLVGCNNSEIPAAAGVTGIGESAFYGCGGLKSASIPDGVSEIGSYAFTTAADLQALPCPRGLPA